FFQAEDGIRDLIVTGVQTCALRSQLDARRLVTHRRIAEAEHQRVMLAEHRPPRGHRDALPDPHPEEKAIVTAAPELADYVAGLRSEERRVGKECRWRWAPEREGKK